MRQDTLETIGLGTVHEIFSSGKLPVDTGFLIDKIFGSKENRGAMVISGANGIVGAGKLMQFGSRLKNYNVPIAALDFPGSPDGIGLQYIGLAASFGKKQADEIMTNVIRLNYDGSNIPPVLKSMNPKFLLEAVPEILEIKKAHYNIFRNAFPGIEIRSVTSGFPASELGVGIAHPSFPHQINKVWEIVENDDSDITKLFWALGMIPVRVTDNWSFVLDVLFCGLTLACLRYNRTTNMPFWKIDKYVRKYFGPNPFRAHDVIGSKGANFLTWSCLHHLTNNYGDVFCPTESLLEHKDSGQNWYPLNHLRPIVNFIIENGGIDEFHTWILGSLFRMTSLMLHENRSHYSTMNAIGELCAQFRKGILAIIRNYGTEKAIKIVEDYHKLYPEASQKSCYKETFYNMETHSWQQLYVNAEHDGKIGIITLGRESYNDDVDKELNRTIDWLLSENIRNVIITGDFHLTTQLVGADTNEFFQALSNETEGFLISHQWSLTARRLYNEFGNSVAFINGKRCLGGMLELFIHCHYIVAVEDSDLGSPEVNLPVVPGMEMCHFPFRRTNQENWQKLFNLLLEGKPVKGKNAAGWLIDYSTSINAAIKMAWELASEGEQVLPKRLLKEDGFEVSLNIDVSRTENPAIIAARKAILGAIIQSCGVPLSEAITVQSRHSAAFMTSEYCRNGIVGTEYTKTMVI